MPGVVDSNGPSYISSHCAELILSEIRPFKLKADALRVINVLLDEFLYKILSTACSLATDKLRASLLNLLPTSLGKEALLEAEVELRTYWERRDPRAALEDDAQTFHLQWAFELLRLKCEAYSTLNEQDEDPTQEARILERFNKAHPYPPVSTLVDPAALYLTAILESMCEHILSNVGRVAARDSSRTYAHVNDLFVALCEDGSIYGLFKTMKVYEQIESMSTSPKTRRSKSFSRSDMNSISRTSSPQNELTLVNTSGSRSRQSSEGALPPAPSANGSRPSFEKAKAMRIFANKHTGEADGQSNHKKSESIKSELRSLADEEAPSIVEDAAMLREFDDLMRSASTMKVSLTPDRLKTMEVYKQEKDSRASRRPNHFPSHSEPDIHPTSRTNSQRPSLRQVDAIVEDEEEQSPKPRPRQISVATPPSTVPVAPNRSRSQSTSSGLPNSVTRKPVRIPSTTMAPSAYPQPSKMQQSHSFQNRADNGFPQRTRVKQRNRESLDLDDVMNGSDDDDAIEPPSVTRKPSVPSVPSTPVRAKPHGVSASTRELMDFLAEGPPEPKLSKNGRDLVDFLDDGPPDFGQSSVSLEKHKPAGRLQRMISKLNLGNVEKTKATQEPSRVSTPTKASATPINAKAYVTSTPSGALASLANRPIPPRPRPISPPSSPSPDSLNENRGPSSHPQEPAHRTPERPHVERVPVPPQPPLVTSVSSLSRERSEKRSSPRTTNARPAGPPSYSSHTNGNGHAQPPAAKDADHKPIIPARTVSHSSITRKPVPPVVVAAPSAPTLADSDIRDMRRLLASATTADECRLIVDIYMTRNGLINKGSRENDAPYPSPSPSIIKRSPVVHDPSLEASLIDHFLCGTPSLDVGPADRRSEELVEATQEPSPAENSLNSSASTHTHDTPISNLPTETIIPVSIAV
ncbi:hypothetical protein CVT24_002123 [Panaeolus cyanescens]|uniref:Uncharacterized protein n=1 Tax=Panaeolus cyanescens TaxID=181874 RepID=A0A409YI26_9AGAR|nr:hypothetical protein CVT24_002123 [Panaeolus cyanescens]